MDPKDIPTGIFRAYDVRGVVPGELNEDVAYRIAQAYVKYANPRTVVLGRDVRATGPALFDAVLRGLTDHGVDVITIGVVPTDLMYFSVVHYGADGGLTVTASHNPAEYNGMKMVLKGAAPVPTDSGVKDIGDIARSGYAYRAQMPGEVTRRDPLDDYLTAVLSFVDVSALKPMHVVANCNYGAVGRGLKALAAKIPVTFTFLNGEPDGTFPKGRPDPLIPALRDETIALVQAEKPAFGAMWDADADRCFFLDETGRFLPGYFTTAVLAEYFLQKSPGSTVVIDLKQNWAIKDAVTRGGGKAVTCKTGHGFFKERMRSEDAVFGGEVSGHYFFRDFHYLDNGLIPFVVMLEMLSQSDKPLSTVYDSYFAKYFPSEEVNFTVKSVPAVLAAMRERYADGQLSEMDGVSVDYPDWRFNVRPSNNEPLLRVNLEAKTAALRDEKLAELAALVNQCG